jgi:alkanesulfonate monooxygenase SsuD/methylene tetrahydromethanopterin reductase-like flavin-dependent oxidoreductase (luciferase family)
MPEPLALLAALAPATTRIALGTLVLCQSFRHPGALAKTAATLSEISGGRFILGIGAGWHEPEYRAFGLPFANRVARFEEYVRILTDLLREGRSDFEGAYFRTTGARLVADQVPPVWIAARGPRMMAITAALADGWNSAWHGEDVTDFADQLRALRRVAAQAGGGTRPLTASAGILVVPSAGEEEANSAWSALASLPSLAQQSEAALRRRVIVAAPERAAGLVRQYWRDGADHIIVSPGPAPFSAWRPDSLRTLGSSLLPLL